LSFLANRIRRSAGGHDRRHHGGQLRGQRLRPERNEQDLLHDTVEAFFTKRKRWSIRFFFLKEVRRFPVLESRPELAIIRL